MYTRRNSQIYKGVNMNDFQLILSSTWQLMSTEFTIYGFTISYAEVYLFSIISGLTAYAIFKILWG